MQHYVRTEAFLGLVMACPRSLARITPAFSSLNILQLNFDWKNKKTSRHYDRNEDPSSPPYHFQGSSYCYVNYLAQYTLYVVIYFVFKRKEESS